jgi:hypothetical protein
VLGASGISGRTGASGDREFSALAVHGDADKIRRFEGRSAIFLDRVETEVVEDAAELRPSMM